MAFFDKVKAAAAAVGDKANEAIEITKLTTKINAEKNAADEVYKKLGTLCYARCQAGGESDPELAALCAEIDAHAAAAAELQKQIEALKADNAPAPQPAAPAARFCPSCGAKMPDGVKFCSACGAKVE